MNIVEVLDVAVDGADNVVVIANFTSSVTFGGEVFVDPDCCILSTAVAKFDRDGNHLWSRHLSGQDYEELSGVALDDAGNVLLAGDFSGTIDLGGASYAADAPLGLWVKLDPEGGYLWSRTHNSCNWWSLATNGADLVSFGMFGGTMDLGGGPLDAGDAYALSLVRLDSYGGHVWSQAYGSFDDPFFLSHVGIAVDGSDHVLATGSCDAAIDFGGGPVSCENDGGCAFFAKLDEHGQHVWSQALPTTGVSRGHQAAADRIGNMVFSGRFEGSADFGSGPVNSVGEHHDGYLLKLDREGHPLWYRTYPDHGGSIAIDKACSIVMAGGFGGTIDFGDGPLTSAGLTDLFVVKYAP